jgi:ABC-type nitrate/sulfonate/bicarbonate transport system substrate-binding protein
MLAAHRAVITGAKSEYQSIADLEGTPIGISRLGSGSQTMAYVMALQQGWATDALQFKGASVRSLPNHARACDLASTAPRSPIHNKH